MKVNIPLMPWQREIILDPHPYKVVIAGRQTGKSHLLQAAITETCNRGAGRSAVIMPIQSQSNEFFQLMNQASNFEQMIDGEPKLWPHPQVWWKSGHFTEYRAFEKTPKRLRGGKWAGTKGAIVACDEANDLNGDKISQIVIPKLHHGTTLYITSTVTHFNWLWEKYLLGSTPNRLWKSWLLTSDRGYIYQGKQGRQDLEDKKSVTPKYIWDSEYMCIPGTDGTQAFPYWNRCLLDAGIAAPKEPQRGRQYIAGLDLGRKRDSEVLVIIDDEGLVVWVEEWEGAKGYEHELMAQQVAARCRYWGAQLIIDGTGQGGAGGQLPKGDTYAEVYKRYIPDLEVLIFSGNRNNETKNDYVSHLMLQTEQRKIKCPRHWELLDKQMQGYRILSSRGGQSIFGAAEGHDDAVCALVIAEIGRKNRRFKAKPSGVNPMSGLL